MDNCVLLGGWAMYHHSDNPIPLNPREYKLKSDNV